jgi:hypothetical protein
LAVRRIKDRFAVEFEQGGRRVFRRLPRGATKVQATELETRLRRDLIDQQLLGKLPDVSLEHAIKCWLEEVVKGRKSEDATNSHAGMVRESVRGFHVGDVQLAAERVRASLRPPDERRGKLRGWNHQTADSASSKPSPSSRGAKAGPKKTSPRKSSSSRKRSTSAGK